MSTIEIPSKRPWESKTNWVALAMALLAFFPEAQQLVKENTELTMVLGPMVFMVLRHVTKGKISIK